MSVPRPKKRKLDAVLNHSERESATKRRRVSSHHHPTPQSLNTANSNSNNNTDKKMKRRSTSAARTRGGGTSGRRRKGKAVKKMTIKKFKVRPHLSSEYENDTVDVLMKAVSDIFAKRGGECSFEELYRFCQSLITLNRGEAIYKRLHALCDTHIASQVSSVSSLRDCDLLSGLHRLWMDYKSEMAAMRQVFLMLDKSYIARQTEVKSLWKMGITLLKRHILEVERERDIADRMTFIMVQRIDAERNGEEIDKTLLKGVMVMSAHLNIYKKCFEPQLVTATKRYYHNLGIKLMAELTVPDYIDAVMKRLDDEHRRCTEYLDRGTLRMLLVAVEEEMVDQHYAKILENGFDRLCDEERVDDLRHLYALFESVHRLEPLHKHFETYCTSRGCEVVNAGVIGGTATDSEGDLDLKGKAKADREMVPKLLAFKERLDQLIASSFAKNNEFRKIIRKSWEYFLNQRQNKPAELMAKFVDHQLQRGGRGISEEELESTLDGVMNILRFVEGKDVFQAFYKKDLAKRLLLNTSSSYEAEKGMILRIRKECGSNLAANLENMFKDIAISQDLTTKFEERRRQMESQDEIEFDLRILTSGCWPTYDTTPIALPSVLQKTLDSFSSFYVSMNSGRKLLWTASLSHCILAANFPKGRKELVLSAFQATVLLLFENKNKMTFGEIMKETKIPRKQLLPTVLSLVSANILRKRSKGNECGDGEEFKVNKNYENRLRRVKVNQIQIVETKQERTKTSKRIHSDRQYQIDAAVVRIMKSRKTLSHQQLMAQCLGQLRFAADPKQIKKRIHSLIESEYLERDGQNSSIYHYKA